VLGFGFVVDVASDGIPVVGLESDVLAAEAMEDLTALCDGILLQHFDAYGDESPADVQQDVYAFAGGPLGEHEDDVFSGDLEPFPGLLDVVGNEPSNGKRLALTGLPAPVFVLEKAEDAVDHTFLIFFAAPVRASSNVPLYKPC